MFIALSAPPPERELVTNKIIEHDFHEDIAYNDKNDFKNYINSQKRKSGILN